MIARTAFLAAASLLLAGPALAQTGDRSATQQRAERAMKDPGIAEGSVRNGVRTVAMLVTEKGFEPSKIKANRGEKLRLAITRKTDRTCATEIVVKEYGIHKPLPLGKEVVVELTPRKSGEINYACGMGHVTGIVFVP